ncbi:uncharacterized protein [Haliotis cracherodii]|uniref:uncharacterized protein n=1 Tax=Haliotis cracherodii TaxID=6455 RepID=UPI0039EB20D9
MAAGVKEVDTVEDFNKLLNDAGGNLVVVHFAAPWAPQCQQMTDVIRELAKDNQLSQVRFVQLEAEKLAEISEKNNIIAVPTFIFFKGGKSVDRLDGANATDLTKKVQSLSKGGAVASPPPQPQKQDLNTRLKQLINSAPVMLFMKGNRQEPRCGFSRQMVSILQEKNVSYSTFDILSDEEVRQGLKAFSNWPTYPQLYANGELLGGLDIVKELVETGELESQLPVQIKLEDRLSPHVDKSTQPLAQSTSQNPSSMCCETVSQSESSSQRLLSDDDSLRDFYSEVNKKSDLNNERFDERDSSEDSSEDDEEEEDVDEEEGESLPLWLQAELNDDDISEMPSKGRGRGKRGRTADARRRIQKLNQRERRALIRSDPSLLSAQREKERLRQMMIRRRDSLILSLPVDPGMSIHDANKMLMEQQRAAGVPEEDITSLQIGRENFHTIGELKLKIEGKRAVDRERTRMKRAQLDENMREGMKKACRERMREKRARLRECDPAAAAAYREREKIRKRIERRRNAMLLSLPDDSLLNPAQEAKEEAREPPPVLPLPLAPEFSSALLVLRENLMRKRQEQKERVRQRRAELREKHPDLAAALREKERIRKRIERRRNNLLLNLSPNALLQATHSMMGQTENGCMDRLHPGMNHGLDIPQYSQHALESDSAHGLKETSEMDLQSRLSADQTSPTSSDSSFNSSLQDSVSSDTGNVSWISNIEKLKKNAEHKKEYNKERMRQKRARIKENPEAFEAMKERERIRKKHERLKKREFRLLPDVNEPLTFSYDVPQSTPSSTATLSNYGDNEGCQSEHSAGQDGSSDRLTVKQEPSDVWADYSPAVQHRSGSQLPQHSLNLQPPEDVSMMKEGYVDGETLRAGDVRDEVGASQADDGVQGVVCEKPLAPGCDNVQSCNKGSDDCDNVVDPGVLYDERLVKMEPDLSSEINQTTRLCSGGWGVRRSDSDGMETMKSHGEAWESIDGGVLNSLRDEIDANLSKDTRGTNTVINHTAPPRELNMVFQRSQQRKSCTPVKTDQCPLSSDVAHTSETAEDCVRPDHCFNTEGTNVEPDGSSVKQDGGTAQQDCIKTEERQMGPASSERADLSTSGSGIPSFSSVEEERDWFQTQLCRLQTRVADTDPQAEVNPPAPSGPRGICNTSSTPFDSPSMASFNFYSSSLAGFPTNLPDVPKVPVSSPRSSVPMNDHLSGIAEVTLRSSLEQVTALAGPEVMQERLQQMVYSAKQAREKANEQARKRREKLRNDPAMKHKYEQIKARDMERKRQQRAKEAEIRTVFPNYNEDRRIKDRERKKVLRMRKTGNSNNSGDMPAVSPFPRESYPREGTMSTTPVSAPSLAGVRQDIGDPAQNCLPSMYASYGVNSQYAPSLPNMQPHPYLSVPDGPALSQPPDIKPVTENYRLTSHWHSV